MLAHCGGRTMPAVFLLLSKKWGVDGRSPPWIRGELLLKKALSFAESAKIFVVAQARVCSEEGQIPSKTLLSTEQTFLKYTHFAQRNWQRQF